MLTVRIFFGASNEYKLFCNIVNFVLRRRFFLKPFLHGPIAIDKYRRNITVQSIGIHRFKNYALQEFAVKLRSGAPLFF